MGDPTGPAPLHIGIDARELLGQPTGVGRYLTELLRAWSRTADLPHRFTLFYPGSAPRWTVSLGPRFAPIVDPATHAGTWWEQMRLPRLVARAGVDVLFSPAYTAPLRVACPSVLFIHDLSFFAHPEWFRWREGARRRWLTKAAAQRARVVFTLSEFSAGEIERWIGVPRTRIRIVRPGSPPVPVESTSTRPPLVLFVGSLFNRRRIPELLAAFAQVASRVGGTRLTLVGDNRTTPRIDPMALADSLGVGARVEWRSYVPDEELERLYDSARVFAFLSDYEGYAMTPMEALAHGAPSVLLDTAVAREVYGSAARFVRPDVGEIAAVLIELLTDERARSALVSEGRRLMGLHTWQDAASLVRAAIEGAV